jgi:RNA polymerase sigma-70 factor (ECF subfamily)
MVLNAGQADSPSALEALEKLCRTYWFPLYAYARRRGHNPTDAEDATQGFFESLLRRNSIAAARKDKGRFRSFLLGAMDHYLADQWHSAHAQKRSAKLTISWDAAEAETRYESQGSIGIAPDKLFERQWAMTLLDAALRRLQVEYEQLGRGKLFLELRFAITGDQSAVPYATLAQRLGSSEPAVRMAVHRLRQRYREVLRAEIAQTVGDESEIKAELEHLRQALSGG